MRAPHRLDLGLALAVLYTLTLGSGAAFGAPLRFFALGDTPYSPLEFQPLEDLSARAVAQGTPFMVHLGDIKSGSSPCTDEGLARIAALFRAQPVPVVYTPGDNEWTDCHRADPGATDPLDRLRRVREVFFGDPGVLRLATLDATADAPKYPENVFFLDAAVMLLTLHVVGSNNGFDRSHPNRVAEMEARAAANRAFLERATKIARKRQARAMVLMMQADPLFERGRGPRGFRGLKRDLVRLMSEFPGPVLLIHGDTHRFRHDRPLIDPDTGVRFDRFVRVEVPGSPMVGGVWIEVDPDRPDPFSAQPVYAGVPGPSSGE